MSASRLIALLDRVLPARWQSAPRDALRRARLLAGILMVVLISGTIDLVAAIAFRSPAVVLITGWVALGIFAASLLLQRLGRRSLTLPFLASTRADRKSTVRIAGGNGLRIEVADKGVGFSAETRARLFQQGFTTKRGGHSKVPTREACAASRCRSSMRRSRSFASMISVSSL
jgi:hypothetical protein